MKLKRGHIVGILAGVLTIIAGAAAFYFKQSNLAYFLFGVGFLIGVAPFVILSIAENKNQREKEDMFLEFSRTLVESVDSGTPISKSIINMKSKKFGALSPHVEKLANQIELGIPLQQALETFAYDTESKTIIRSITLIREADKTGGNINNILQSVAQSVSETEKLRAERRAGISSIVMEGYIIFFIFIIIMIIMEFWLLPMTAEISNISGIGDFSGASAGAEKNNIDMSEFSIAFLSLLITQGLFAGLIIGKLAEGNLKAGIKHSFIMVAMAILMFTGSKLIL